jgi:hypothetical protein
MRQLGAPKPVRPFADEATWQLGLDGKPAHPWKFTFFIYLIDAATIALVEIIMQVKASGAMPLRAIAKALNARGIAAARGGVWTPVQVKAVLRRASSVKPSRLLKSRRTH